MSQEGGIDLSNDARVEWISTRIMQSLNVNTKMWEKVLKQQDTVDAFTKFFAKDTHMFLYIGFVGDTRELKVSLTPIISKRKGFVIMRLEPRVITNDNFKEVITYEELFEDPLTHLTNVLKEVYLPLIANKKNQKRWPTVVRQDILRQFHRFIGTLGLFSGHLKGITMLPVPPLEEGMKKEHPEEDRGLVHTLESAVTDWTKEVKKVIENDSERNLNMLENKGIYPGPLSEIEFWKIKSSNLKNLYEQLNDPKLTQVITILRKSESSYVSGFDKMLIQLKAAMLEAEDIYKYLLPLKSYFVELHDASSEDITKIQLIFRPILHLMTLVWQHCKYCTTSLIIVLLRQICNDIIQQVYNYIEPRSLWDSGVEVISEKITISIGFCNSFKELFYEYKEKVNQKNTEKQWRFENISVFQRFNSFIERLQDLLDIVLTIQDFSQLERVEIGGIKGEVMSIMINQVYQDFLQIQRKIQSLEIDFLDIKDPEFDKMFNEYRSTVKDLDKRLCHIISMGFQHSSTILNAFKLLEYFQTQTRRELIKKEVDAKYIQLIKLYENELTAVYRLFVQNKDNPPILSNLPRVAGTLAWCHGLMERITWPVLRFRQLDKSLTQSPEMRQVIKKYNYLVKKMREYESKLQKDWARDVQEITKEKLEKNLLVRNPDGRLVVNFDTALSSCILEVKYLNLYKVDIPQEATNVYSEKEEFRQYVAKIETMVRQYNTIILTVLDVEKPLIIDRLKLIDFRIQDALTKIKWNSDVKIRQAFLQEAGAAVKDMYDRLNYLKGNVKTIEKLIQSWQNLYKVITTQSEKVVEETKRCSKLVKSIAFWRIEDKLGQKQIQNLANKIFVQWQKKMDTTVSRASDIIDQGKQIHLIVRRSRYKIRAKTNSEHWQNYVSHLNQMVADGLFRAIKGALQYLIQSFEPVKDIGEMGVPHKKDGFNVLLESTLELSGTQAIFTPDITDEPGSIPFIVQRWVDNVLRLPAAIKLLNDERNTFYNLVSNNEELKKLEQTIAQLKEITIGKLVQLKSAFTRYSYLWLDDRNEFLRKFVTGQLDDLYDEDELLGDDDTQKKKRRIPLDQYEQEIIKYENLYQEIQELPENAYYGWIVIRTQPLRQAIGSMARKWRYMFLEYLQQDVQQQLEEFDNFVKTMTKGLQQEVPKDDYPKLVEMMGYLLQISEMNEQVKDDQFIQPLRETVQLLKKYEIVVSEETLKQIDEGNEKWKNLMKLYFDVKDKLSVLQQEEIKKITKVEIQFNEMAEQFGKSFQTKAPFAFKIGPKQAYETIDALHLEMLEVEKSLKDLQTKQKLFGLMQNQGVVIKGARSDLKLLKQLWDMVDMILWQIDDWKKLPFLEINTEDMEEMTNKFSKLIKDFDKRARRWNVYTGLQETVQNFLVTLPLIQRLRNEGMRERHWGALMKKTNVMFQLSKNFKLKDLLALNLHKYIDDVGEIVDRAIKEMQMEREFGELDKSWSTLEFEFEDQRGVSIVKVPEDAIILLEDHTSKLQNMSNNRFIDFFLDSLNEWQKKLGDVETITSLFTDVQKTWLYLESIFVGSEDIREQLPEDTKRFDAIDVELKKVMASAKEKPIIVEFCSTDGLEETLLSLQENLAKCEKQLTEYLETKKKAFPRFYFVSVTDLLDILSKGGQSCHNIVHHMSKLFQAVESLSFKTDEHGNKTNQVIGLTSREGEEVEFDSSVALEGKVEDYLNKLLVFIRESLRDILAKAIRQYTEMPREKWLITFPAQIVLIASQIYYTMDVGAAFEGLEENNENEMKDFQKKQISELNDLIKMVQKELPPNLRQKIMNLVTIQVHARDIVQKLIDENITSAQAFQWQSQLRQYWKEKERECIINICDASFQYGFEYLGNAPRLVITPLTDRIYITLTQSLHLVMGGAPAGPAGTGKTETTKDLGGQLGKTVYVFNCSDQMDHNTLGDIFKGLASSGSWGCFDEFNRIAVEVLSVVSTQFKCILDAIKEKKTKFTFISDEIVLDRTVGVFITMNPGYLGRTELPESLKALFRPVTVVVPDLELICENMLMAEGFISAKMLAKKFITLYALNKDLLSKQDHYDWGLRAIKSVLVVAGSLRRAEPHIAEDHILMRALRDFNLPKIVQDDVDVFSGLIEDLFPGIDLPRKVDKVFEDTVAQVVQEMGCQYEENLIVLKVVQLYEVMIVRHSVFIIGLAGSGKSTVWKALAFTLRKLGKKVAYKDINPKAVTNHQLYGYFSEASDEWKDGLISKTMRDFANEPDKNPKWIILDGDLDTEWIESMNSVMDDNRILTLANNDRIPLLPHMRLLFEISHLRFATPATVSRAGIVYVGERDIGWNPYVASWIDKRPQAERAQLVILFERYVADTLKFLSEECKTIVPMSDFAMVQNLCKLLNSLLTEENAPQDKDLYEQYFIFAVIWAFGGALATSKNYKTIFSTWFRKQYKKFLKMPDAGSVFDYCINMKTKKFERWKDMVKPFTYSPDMDLPSIMVPTEETQYMNYFLNMMVHAQQPFMLVGNAGCGKTQVVKAALAELEGAVNSKFMYTTINFNYYTDSQTLQTTMEKSLERKGGRRYGPKGGKRLIFFIDDLNMPAVDQYDTQSPIALLRQHIDYNHWYERNKWTLRDIINIQYVACMNPTAGSFRVNPRLQRHFFTLTANFPERPSLVTIYSTILNGHLKHFPSEITGAAGTLLDTILEVHERVASTFQKTAVHFHYEFNLRHLSNVFEGLLRTTPKHYHALSKMVRLFVHEAYRVYADRLALPKHVETFTQLIKGIVQSKFPDLDTEATFKEPLVFSSFAYDTSDDIIYDEFPSPEKYSQTLEQALEDHNSKKAVMNLVLFEDAMAHVCRIARIIEGALGNALLVGVGGSGKQSLAKLAAFMCDFEVYQITITRTYGVKEFQEDLREMYKRSGLRSRPIVFLFTDTQIIDQKFLVYINDMLSSGNIADLFNDDQIAEIATAIKSKAKEAGIIDLSPENCYRFFIERVRKYLHVVLCFSPVGDNFRVSARKFPALINCTVIDWFFPWPHEALLRVANRFLKDEDLKEFQDPIVKFMAFAHETVNEISIKYRQEQRRYMYTTPKSYLELIKLYKSMLKKKREELLRNIKRLENGIEKLNRTKEDVGELEKILKQQEAEVQVKQAATQELLDKVGKDKKIVDEENRKAMIEEEKVTKIKLDVEAKARDCEEDLKRAEPMVQRAMEALDTLSPKDLTEMRSFANPPADVVQVMAAVMTLLSPKRLAAHEKKWSAAQKTMAKGADAFLQTLKNYDKNNIPDVSLRGVEEYIAKPNFNPEVVRQKSKAAAGLCEWVINIVKYYKIYMEVLPKRERLEQARANEREANEKLNKVKKKVARLKAKLQKLTEEFEAANQEKLEVIAKAKKTTESLQLAHRLINALSNENARWVQELKDLKEKEKVLIGDVLLAAAFVSYAGGFDITYRRLLTDKWLKFIKDNKIPISSGINAIDVLVNDATIAEWNNQLLPSDQTSIENGCILTNCERWPLIIDPQLQGITWIKKKFENLKVFRLGQKGLIEKIERAIENGDTVLIENIGETIDAVLAPVLGRNVIIKNKIPYIKLEHEVIYDPNFKLIFHTKLSNPHYIPEIQAETTLINFAVTEKGLEDQLLAIVVSKERKKLEDEQSMLRKQQNEFKITLRDLENNLLDSLEKADQEKILSDVALIENLEKTQETAQIIKEKVRQAKETEIRIQKAREEYRPVAARGSLLYFLLDQLKSIQNMYHFSLNAFVVVFNRAMALTPQSDNVQERIQNLIKVITLTVFNYVNRGLFERHKLIFATNLCLKILEPKLDPEEVEWLIQNKKDPSPGENPYKWMSAESWASINSLKRIEPFAKLVDDIGGSAKRWEQWATTEFPEKEKLPQDWKNKTEFQKLLIIKALRPDRLTQAVAKFVADNLGKEYVEPQPFSMDMVYAESKPSTPMFFILFPGADPIKEIESFGKKLGFAEENNKFANISLGSGQQKRAENALLQAYKTGGWVVLQNIHLMQKWLPTLEQKLEELSEGSHKDFRVFLTAEPTQHQIPQSILQASIKITNEPPQNLKANLLRAFNNFNQDTLDSCSKQQEFKSILFSLCFFHALVLGRRMFGPIGWSRSYSFNVGDLTISANVLFNYLEANDKVPWEDIRYIFGEIMYGGHITDEWDRRVCSTYLKCLMKDKLFEEMELAPGFMAPQCSTHEEFVEYIEQNLPDESPIMFGLHPNSEISFLTKEADTLFNTIIELRGGTGATSTTAKEEQIAQRIQELLSGLPQNFQVREIASRIDKKTPYVCVVLQECERMNILLSEIRRSLKELELGLKGELTISEQMDELLNALYLQRVPATWAKVAYPSMKSLTFWFEDLLKRVQQLDEWSQDLILPKVVWISGLFNPMSFVTAVIQTTARKTQAALDSMCIQTEVLKKYKEEITGPPRDGCYIHGMFLEGAGWEIKNGTLRESKLKELYTPMPVIHIKAIPIEKRETKDIYECPVFVTPQRGPTYLFTAQLKTKVDPSKWILAGVALLLST